MDEVTGEESRLRNLYTKLGIDEDTIKWALSLKESPELDALEITEQAKRIVNHLDDRAVILDSISTIKESLKNIEKIIA